MFLRVLHESDAVAQICRFLDRSGTVRALSSLSRSSRDAPFVKPTIKALKETALADGVLYALRHHTSVASRICLLSGGLECLPALACVSAQMDEATHVTEFLHAIKRDEERNDWLLKSDEEKDGELFAIDCLVARALPNVVEVAELRVGNVALHFAARAALDGFVRQASSTKIAEKKDDPVKTKCGAVGRLTKTPKTGCYSIRLSADHAKGDKGKVVSFRTKEIEEKYLKPAVANIEASACCVGIIGYGHGYGLPSGARKVTVDNLLKHGEKLAEKEAEAKEKTILEVNYKFFDQGRPAFEAALRAAPTRAAELHLIRKEALLLQNMPSENITIGVQSFCLPRIEALEILAGPGYQRDSKSYKEEGPGGRNRIDVLVKRIDAELARRPLLERLRHLVECRRRYCFGREDGEKRDELYMHIMSCAPLRAEAHAELVFSQSSRDRAKARHLAAEARRKGEVNPIASWRWNRPLSPDIRFGFGADALPDLPRYLIPTASLKFNSLEQFVVAMEHGAKSKPHLYPGY